MYAPRTWRCFYLSPEEESQVDVCSTHVEMFPEKAVLMLSKPGMLHARGDVSLIVCQKSKMDEYAPRTWRCFYIEIKAEEREVVCSTHVEMFPGQATFGISCGSMLHARGDVST